MTDLIDTKVKMLNAANLLATAEKGEDAAAALYGLTAQLTTLANSLFKKQPGKKYIVTVAVIEEEEK